MAERATLHIRKNDIVKVISGKEKGKVGRVLKVDREKGRITVEKVNMVKRHAKPGKKNPQGGIIEREAPVDVSNVMLVCPACGQPTRVGYRVLDDGGKVRVCRRENCRKDIDKA